MSDKTYSSIKPSDLTLEDLQRTVAEFRRKHDPFAGFRVVESEWVPKDKIVMMSPCHCDSFQRSQPLHMAQHLRIINLDPPPQGATEGGE